MKGRFIGIQTWHRTVSCFHESALDGPHNCEHEISTHDAFPTDALPVIPFCRSPARNLSWLQPIRITRAACMKDRCGAPGS